MDNLCDKCRKPVDPKNNAVLLAFILGEINTLGAMFAQPRHLLSTEGCPGSPSRAQYLAGQPRDSRPEYSYIPEKEDMVRSAYQLLQDEADAALLAT